jgi:hypothetical protein
MSISDGDTNILAFAFELFGCEKGRSDVEGIMYSVLNERGETICSVGGSVVL